MEQQKDNWKNTALIGVTGVVMALLLLRSGLAAGRNVLGRYFLLVSSIGVLMAARSIHSVFISRQAALENFIPLAFSLLLSALVVAALSVLDHFDIPGPVGRSAEITWHPVSISLSLAGGIFLLQLLAP